MSVKCVRNIDTGKIYNSVREAARQTGVGEKSISANCVGRTKTAGGYKWEYITNNIDNNVIKHPNNKMPIKVKNLTTNVIYNSIAEAGRALNVDSSAISKVCKGKLKSAGGYKWEYVHSDISPNDVAIDESKLCKKADIIKYESQKSSDDNLQFDNIKIEVNINNHSQSQTIANYWIKKIIDFDYRYYLNEFIKDSKYKNEQELDKSINQLYLDMTNNNTQPIKCYESSPMEIKINISTETRLNETIEYWANKLAHYDTKYWIYKLIQDSQFKNEKELDEHLKNVYELFISNYKRHS